MVSSNLVRYASLFALFALLADGSVPSAFATTNVVVSPSNMHGWVFALTDSSGVPGTGAGTGQFVTGPASPPFGIGSANLATGSGQGDGSAQIETMNFDGTLLSALTSLGYSTYDTVNNGQQFPYLKISISTGLGSPSDDALFFEPPYQNPSDGSLSCPNQGNTAMNTWQSWDALNGCWWDNNGIANPGTGVMPLSAIESAYPGAVIQSFSPGQGVSLRVGFGSSTDDFNGYVDGFTIAASNLCSGAGCPIVYDFEPSATGTGVPEFPLGLIALVAICIPALILLKGKYGARANAPLSSL